MEKIKIERKEIKNKKIKFLDKKVEVRPIITSEDLLLIANLCIEKLTKDFSNLANSSFAHTLFDMCVTELCTNIAVDGIFHKNNSIEINLDKNNILNFNFLNINNFLKNNISNYSDAWNDIMFILNLQLNKLALSEISKGLPNAKDLEQTVKSFAEALDEMNKRDPEALKKIIDTAMQNSAIQQTREELKEKKQKKNNK